MTRSGYRFLPNVAIADIAFRVRSRTLPVLFETAAKAMTEVMVDRRTLRPALKREINVSSSDRDTLLYDFLTEIIILKDVESLLFKTFKVSLNGETSLTCLMSGEQINRERHKLRNDVKAVTMHMFGIKKGRGGWSATIVVDI